MHLKEKVLLLKKEKMFTKWLKLTKLFHTLDFKTRPSYG